MTVDLSLLPQFDFTQRSLTIVAALVGLLGPASAWLSDRSVQARRGKLLKSVTERVVFWDLWLAKTSVLAPVTDEQKDLISKELNRSAEIIRDAFRFWPPPEHWKRSEYRLYLKGVGVWRRLWMRYELPTENARQARIAVYATVGVPMSLWLFAHLVWAVRGDMNHKGFFLPVSTLVIFAVGILLYRWLAWRQEVNWLKEPVEE